jgi:hypothetical protein
VGGTGRSERVLETDIKLTCKEKFYSISTVLMVKNLSECAILTQSRISPNQRTW